MFGVVPKVLWERCCAADELNRVALSLTCLLIRAHGKNILVDTGVGSKEDVKFQKMFAVDRSVSLEGSLKHLGLTRDDIHLVINTHLHFDHAGGNTMRNDRGALIPVFPKARYVVQRGEYEDAVQANERTKASYRDANFMPITDADRWDLLDGDTELLPGITTVVTPGHTRCHQSIKIESEGQAAFYLGDLIPTACHLPLPYIMGYDLAPVQTLETKRHILDSACEERWLLLFEHDPTIHAGYVRRNDDGKYHLDEVSI